MTISIPGVLVSRDGTVRPYIGHSNRGGVLYGKTERDGGGWVATCARCRSEWRDYRQRDVVYSLRDHWWNADASMSETHS